MIKNVELYICKNHISALVHKEFKPLRKPSTFYNHVHHIVNELYGNNLMYHRILSHETKYLTYKHESEQ